MTHQRNTTGLKPATTTEEARRLARLSAAARQPTEPSVRIQATIYARQRAAIDARGLNASALIRELLDAWLLGTIQK